MTRVSAGAEGLAAEEMAIADAEQAAAWRSVAERVHGAGARR